jgi:hypothetical protein
MATGGKRKFNEDDDDVDDDKGAKKVKPGATKEGKAVKKMLEHEVASSSTSPKWKGGDRGVEVDENVYRFDKSTIEYRYPDITTTINDELGKPYGCHTCNWKVEKDRDQPWVGDHIPPTELCPLAREILACATTTYLFPQCGDCAEKQSALVRKLNNMTRAELNAFENDLDESSPEYRLINGGKAPIEDDEDDDWNCVASTGSRVKPHQGLSIQGLGTRQYCHSCGSKYPVSRYIADHVFPKAFVTSGMKSLFLQLEIPWPTKFVLRPQCKRCSTNQGGHVGSIVTAAREYAKTLGIVIYEVPGAR